MTVVKSKCEGKVFPVPN